MRVDNPDARVYYMNEAAEAHWSSRILERQINSFYYERLLADKNKVPAKQETGIKTFRLKETTENQIKDPYVLE